MATAERLLTTGSQRAARIRTDLGLEIRHARHEHGLSQAAVAGAERISKSQVGRIERAENRDVSIFVLARRLAVLGMELSARAYPAGQPVRDAAHRDLLERLRRSVGPRWKWTYERPLPGSGDQRAWDAAVALGNLKLAVDAETRLTDLQSFERRERLKLRDDATVDGCLLVVADTRHNRAVLRASRDAFAGFDRISAGELPDLVAGGNRLVLL